MKKVPQLLKKYPEKILLGYVSLKPIYLYIPKWDCNWYWGFGYIGNNNCHYHLSLDDYNTNLYDAIKLHFDKNSFRIKEDKDIWVFCEIVKTIYLLRKISELYYRGSSNYTNNPYKELLQNLEEYENINYNIIPTLIDGMYQILLKYE